MAKGYKNAVRRSLRILFAAAGLGLCVLCILLNEADVRRSREEKEAISALADVSAEAQTTSPAQETETVSREVQPDIYIPDCGTINYSVREKKSDFKYRNPDDNSCYLRISITRRDTSETVYASQLISPGREITDAVFFPDFHAAGIYEAMVKVDAYALDEMSLLNSLVIETTINAY